MNTHTTTATTSTLASIPTYAAFWEAFRTGAAAVLTQVTTGVERLYEGQCAHTIEENACGDEFSVILTHRINSETICDLQLILKDGDIESDEQGVGIGIDLYDHREQFQRIDGIVQNYTPAVWKLSIPDLEDAVSQLDLTYLVNSVLSALRRQQTLAL